MTFVADTISFWEIATKETLPLNSIQQAVIEFLCGRNDVVLCGAHAVNVYANDPRMTQDVDLLATRACAFAEELSEHLSRRFRITIQVREGKTGRGYRLFQLRETDKRQLVDVYVKAVLPQAQRIADVMVISPIELIASKVCSIYRRRGEPKEGTDRRDLALLLLAFPKLKRDPGPVTDFLNSAQADQNVLALWRELVAQEIMPESDEDHF
jgi:hypothetical protein